MTPEEIKEALKNPEIANQLKEEFVIRTPEEEEEFRNRYKQQIVDNEIGNKIKEVHDRYDQDFKELFGEEKPAGVKTYEWGKSKIQSILEEKKQLADSLEKAKKDSNSLAEYEEEKKRLQKQYQESIEKIQAEKEEVINQYQSEKKNAALQSIYSDISKDLPSLPSYFDSFKRELLNKAANKSKEIDGEMVMLDDEGKPKMDLSTMKYVTVREWMQGELKPIQEELGINRSGVGSGSGKSNPDRVDPENIDPETFKFNEDPKNLDELREKLVKIGIDHKHSAYNKIYTRYKKDLNLKYF